MRSERVAVAEGVALHANVWDGDGVPFLLVHGLSSNARLWDGVAEHLAARGHLVVAIDQRGHGLSDKPDTGYDFQTLVSDLLRIEEAFELERPVAAGQSWGANVVLELGAQHPDRVRGVVAIDGAVSDFFSRFRTWEECEAAMAPPPIAGMPRAQMEAGVRRRHADWPETGIQGALACYEARPDGTIAPWLTRERHLLILRELWQHNPFALYPTLEVNALLMPCRSPGSPRAAARQTAVDRVVESAPRVRVQWFDADHDVHAQYPEAVASSLAEAVAEGFFS